MHTLEENKQSSCFWRQTLRYQLLGLLTILQAIFVNPTVAEVSDLVITDVTTRAFSVVWVSDEPVGNATITVFSDENGFNDITNTLNINLVSTIFPSALSNGIVKIDVTGLTADTTVFLYTETVDMLGTTRFPAESDPFIEVTTSLESTKLNDQNDLIINDLLQHELFVPDGMTPAEGALVLIKAPGISQYPISTFVGNGMAAALVDLNNLFNDTTGSSAEVVSKTPLEIIEYRGLRCDVPNQKQIHRRRTPEHEETPPITELETPAPCYSPTPDSSVPEGAIPADFDCDSTIGPGDFNLFLAQFGLTRDEITFDCQFNADFDLAPDGTIGSDDFNLFLSVCGAMENSPHKETDYEGVRIKISTSTFLPHCTDVLAGRPWGSIRGTCFYDFASVY